MENMPYADDHSWPIDTASEWAAVDPLQAAEAVLAQTSYLVSVPPSPRAAGAELDALTNEMRGLNAQHRHFAQQIYSPGTLPHNAEFFVQQQSPVPAHQPYATQQPYSHLQPAPIELPQPHVLEPRAAPSPADHLRNSSHAPMHAPMYAPMHASAAAAQRSVSPNARAPGSAAASPRPGATHGATMSASVYDASPSSHSGAPYGATHGATPLAGSSASPSAGTLYGKPPGAHVFGRGRTLTPPPPDDDDERGGGDERSGDAAAALRALQDMVRGLEAERAQLYALFEQARASALSLELQLRQARLDADERSLALVSSLDGARAHAARAADAQGAQLSNLRRELDHVTQLAQAAEAEKRVTAAQLEQLERELAETRADSAEHAAETEARSAGSATATAHVRARSSATGAQLTAVRAERAGIAMQRERTDASLRHVLHMNGQLIDKLARRPARPAAPPRDPPAASWPLSDDGGSESTFGEDESKAGSPRRPPPSAAPTRAHAELGRVLAQAEAELESARREYGAIVDGAYAAALRGEESAQGPIVACLHRVEAKVRAYRPCGAATRPGWRARARTAGPRPASAV
jgi:hypothetical protein